jgi:hypothetical protein
MSVVIPFSVAHPILEAFGISKRTRAYDRWEKPDGFALADFGEVLSPDSPRIFHIDWRDTLADALKGFETAVCSLDFELEYVVTEDESSASFRLAGREWRHITYSPRDDDGDYGLIARAFSAALPEELELRAGRTNGGSDSGSYALLTRASWKEILLVDERVVSHFFVPMST